MTALLHRSRHLVLLVTAALALAVLVSPTAARAESAPAGTEWYETYIDTPDGESLHVDVIHPVDLPEDAGPRPVVLVVSPYLGVSGAPGPVNRFYDLYLGAYDGEGLFANGWSVVQVSTRGTGGSSGCLDILGPGEQTDIVTAVDWLNAQPWVDGVAMYGKSYDGNTGAAAMALRPRGLDAIVAQAIGPDRYRATHNDRVRLAQSLLYPSVTYGTQGEAGFSTQSSSEYILNSVSHSADCQAHFADHYRDDETLAFWRIRDFPDRAEGSSIPAFITAGYLDNATNIGGGAVDLFNALDGPKHLWLGWWGHRRGNDDVDGRSAVGRDGFLGEVTAFLEHHVRGTPRSQLPDYPDYTVAAQTSTGGWRYEDAFPAADTSMVDVPLLGGSYVDDGSGRGSADSSLGAGGLVRTGGYTDGVWTFTDPLPAPAQVAGIATATLTLRPQLPRSNVVVNLYDVDPTGQATMITRGAGLVDEMGEETIRLWPTDWVFGAGHRLGIRVTDANTENYVHVPTNGSVQLISGRVSVPVLPVRVSDAEGGSNPDLEGYRRRAPFSVAALLPAAPTNVR